MCIRPQVRPQAGPAGNSLSLRVERFNRLSDSRDSALVFCQRRIKPFLGSGVAGYVV